MVNSIFYVVSIIVSIIVLLVVEKNFFKKKVERNNLIINNRFPFLVLITPKVFFKKQYLLIGYLIYLSVIIWLIGSIYFFIKLII